METMVERYHAELLPVAAQLTARLVRADHGLIERTSVLYRFRRFI